MSPEDGVLIISVGQPGVETTVSLLCLSQGGPWNVYTWNTAPSDDSEFTSNFAENVAVNGAELIIKNVRFNSDRLYKCEVTNPAGSGSDVVSLIGKIINVNQDDQLLQFCVDPSGVFDEFLPFYDLQGISGVQELPKTQDAHSSPIFVPGGMVFGSDEITRVFVSIFHYYV